MNELVLSGRWESALSHMALFGLGAILESEADPAVRVHWAATPSVQPTVTTRLTETEIAESVRDHAHRSMRSWVGARFIHLGQERAIMSPRLGEPKSAADWKALRAAREEWLDSTELSVLDRRMISGLGELGYWCWVDPKEIRPGFAASPWEMKTRNHGEEFVRDRLAKLADAVRERALDDVEAGLFEGAVLDEKGNNSPASRTPTGFTAPRPTDSAMAWCALWGIACHVVRPRTHVTVPARRPNHSVASGVITGGRQRWFVLPVFRRATNMARLRQIVRSHHVAATAEARNAGSLAAASEGWLVGKGVGAVVGFAQHTTDNSNAPEHWLTDGVTWPLMTVSTR